MLFFAYFLCWTLVHSSLATINPEGGRMLGGIYIYQDEPECIREGGLCVKESDCLELHARRGLCPLNANQGVECCFRIPVRPAPCKEHLGECMASCNPRIQRPATDCAKDQACCVLVR